MFNSLRRTAGVAARKVATARPVQRVSVAVAARSSSSSVARAPAAPRAVTVAARRVAVPRRRMSTFRRTPVWLADASTPESLDGVTHSQLFDHKYDNADVTSLAVELSARRKDDPYLIPPTKDENPQVWMEIDIAGKPAGRIQIEVRADAAPKAAENFKALCTGQGKLSYKGTKLYEWFSGYYVNGGDITNNNGTGGDSIYGGDFVGEQSDNPMGIGSIHLLASQMNSEESQLGKRDVVNSKFSILMIDMPSVLAGQGVLVAQVLRGMEVLEDVQAQPVTQSNNMFRPSVEVTIRDCGEVAEKEKMKIEDFKDKAQEE